MALTQRQIAERIAKDRATWLTKQFKKLFNRLFCIVRNRDDEQMHEVEEYIDNEKITIDLSPLTAAVSKKGRLVATWQANVKISEPSVLPVLAPVIITDANSLNGSA